MPDHQIVVKLNKEQFEEAQRLAKLAGLRSATAYVREKILELLEDPQIFSELGGFALELPHRIIGVDRDIERIQTDLQQFINESEQANYEFNYRLSEQINLKLEEEARPSRQESNKTDSNEPELQSTIDLASSLGQSMTDSVFDTTSNINEPKIEATSYRNDDVEKNVWRAEPQQDITDQIEEEEMQAALNSDSITVSGSFDSPAPSQEIKMQAVLDAVDDANDELEEMADRAFSISPRLGVIETSGPTIEADDPLADLLDEHLIDKLVFQENQINENLPISDPGSQEEASNWATNPGLNSYQPASSEESQAPLEEAEETIDLEHGAENQAPEESGSESTIRFEESENYDLEELRKLQEELNEVASGKISQNLNEDENNEDLDQDDNEEEEEDEEPKFHDVSGGPPPKRRKS